MNRHDIEQMALEADFRRDDSGIYHSAMPEVEDLSENLIRFARFVAERERKECADAARNAPIKTARQDGRDAAANAIMARGLTDK